MKPPNLILLIISAINYQLLFSQDFLYKEAVQNFTSINPSYSGNSSNTKKVDIFLNKEHSVKLNSILRFNCLFDIGIKAKNEIQKFGLGINIGTVKNRNGTYQKNNFSLSTSYRLSLKDDDSQFFALGFIYTFQSIRSKPIQLILENPNEDLRRYENGLYVSQGYGNQITNIPYFSLGSGIYYQSQKSNINYNLGISLLNINKQIIQKNGVTISIHPLLYVHGQLNLKSAEENQTTLSTIFQVLEMKKINFQTTVLHYVKNLNTPNRFVLGCSFFKDLNVNFGASPTIGYELNKISVFISHDLTIKNYNTFINSPIKSGLFLKYIL